MTRSAVISRERRFTELSMDALIKAVDMVFSFGMDVEKMGKRDLRVGCLHGAAVREDAKGLDLVSVYGQGGN